MPVHQFNPEMAPDSDYLPGNLEFLVPQNRCRRLDPRRTPGFIEAYFENSAMFRFQITDFEDKGKYWDLPAEEVLRFQFEKGSHKLPPEQVQGITERVAEFQSPLVIQADPETIHMTEEHLTELEANAVDWLKSNSSFLSGGGHLDLKSRRGPEALANDLTTYLNSHGLGEIEQRTTENIVLNPHSGEWVKGMEIVMADMGLVDYHGTVTRTAHIFSGEGSKESRRRYISQRLAFVWAYFHLLDIEEVRLFRGMSSERDWEPRQPSLISTSFSLRVARSLAHFDRADKFRYSSLVKRTVPVELLFMTYLETAAMNRQYFEAEALVMGRANNPFVQELF